MVPGGKCEALSTFGRPISSSVRWRGSSFTQQNFVVVVVYLFLTERDRVQVREGQREGETQNLKQAPRL